MFGDDVEPTRNTCEARRCDWDDQCPNSYVCDRVCAARSVCESDAQCGASEECRVRFDIDDSYGARKTCEEPLCHADEECPPDQICEGSSIETRICRPGVCASSAECAPVLDTMFVVQCRVRETENPGASRKNCMTVGCVSDAECPSDALCYFQTACLRPEEGTCESDAECLSPSVCGAASWRTTYDAESERGVCQEANPRG